MYKVVLVDDDVYVTEFLEKMIPWEKYGFKVVASFNDSIQSYDYLENEKCDVLITDIGMPRLNGIELISKLRKEDKPSYYVILSCHDDFHFAQQALKLEVFDYILKESMEEDKVVELIKRLKDILDKESKSKDYQVKIDTFLKQNNMTLKTRFIERVMEEQYSADDHWWEVQEELLNMDLSHKRYTVTLCFIDQYEDALSHYRKEILLQFSLNNVIEEVLIKFNQDAQIFFLKGKFMIMFPLMNQGKHEMQARIEWMMGEIQSKIETYLKISLTAIIGEENQLRKGLVQSIKLLLSQEEGRFYYPHGTIQSFQSPAYTDESIFQDYIDKVQKIRHMIMNKEKKQIKEFIQNEMKTIQAKHYAPAAVKDWALKLVLDIKIYLNAQVHFEDKNLMTMTDRLVQNVETIEHLQLLLTDVLVKLIYRVDEIMSMPKNEYVQQAHTYIRSHLNEKITLKDIATVLHLNASYFSRMFKKETGESFIACVTRIKMEKARELLDHSTRSVEQISIELGFDSKSYFLKTFRKQFGMSPKEYKHLEAED